MKTAKVFTMKTCGPCMIYAIELKSLTSEGFVITTIDIDDNPDVKSQYNLKAAPTTIIFEDGEEVERFMGMKSRQQLKEKLQ